jgi:hypothetical protein
MDGKYLPRDGAVATETQKHSDSNKLESHNMIRTSKYSNLRNDSWEPQRIIFFVVGNNNLILTYNQCNSFQ